MTAADCGAGWALAAGWTAAHPQAPAMPDPVFEAKRMLQSGDGTPRIGAGAKASTRARDGFGSATNFRARGQDSYYGPARTRSPTTERGRRLAKEGSPRAKVWEYYDPDHPGYVCTAQRAPQFPLPAAAGVSRAPAGTAFARPAVIPLLTPCAPCCSDAPTAPLERQSSNGPGSKATHFSLVHGRCSVLSTAGC